MLELGIGQDLYSLLVGSITMGGLCGCLLAGKLVDRIGRKRALIASFSIAAVGWLGVGCSISPAMIFSGRIVHGIGEGMIVAVSNMYLGENIEERYRGGAISSLNVSILFGIALAYILGVFISWRVSAALCVLMNMVSLFFTLFLPESSQCSTLKG